MQKNELMKIAKKNLNPLQRIALSKAIDYATKKHAGQKRASGENYISHPLAVAALLIEWQLDIDTVIAGILHDTVEDTETSLDDIVKHFGEKVAFLVDGVTKVSKARSGMRQIDTYLPKTRDNLSKLLIAVGQDARVVLIKLADRLHNLRTLQYLHKEKQLKIAAESLEIFARLADRLGMGRVRVEIEEIAFSYLEPKRYQYLRKISKKRISKAHARFESIKNEVTTELNRQKIKHQIDGRIKSIYSLHKKLAKYDENLDEIYDLIALRIIVKNKSDCYRVLGVLHNIYKPMVNRIKDYIATPKLNGYQSLHTTVDTNIKQVVEFQVRTEKMHDFAEHGLAASFHYNEQKQHKNYFLRRKSQPAPQHKVWVTELQDTARALREGTAIDDLKIDLFGNRIFVYSPKGDIYDLPEGAYPLDFAYSVHSDVGDHAQTFLVNGAITRFTQPLANGDTVEVKVSKTTRVKKDWLKSVKTSKARNKIKASLQKQVNAHQK